MEEKPMRTSFAVATLIGATLLSAQATAQGAIRGTVHGPPGVDLSSGVVYACYSPGGNCDNASPHSKMVPLGARGPSVPFEIPGLARGQYTVLALVDRNGNGQLDPGDLLGGHEANGTAILVSPPAQRLAVRLQPIGEELAQVIAEEVRALSHGSAPATPSPASGSRGGGVVPAAVRPPPGRELNGIYVGVRLDAGVVNQYGNTQYAPGMRTPTFFPDGRVIWSPRPGGYAQPVDWSSLCTRPREYGNPCGTYQVHGDEVHVRWESGYLQFYRRDGDNLVMLRHHWVDTSPRTNASELVHLRRTPPVDGLRLDGHYRKTTDPAVQISFTSDGRFVEQGLILGTNTFSLSAPEYNRREEIGRRVTRGAGTYTLNRYTLELRYDGGLVVPLLFHLSGYSALGSRPPGFTIETAEFERVR
jgi:uncharacterized protein (DUF2141 family)